jgi:sn-glycerol 3-phosphate transport system substrate-binding protein
MDRRDFLALLGLGVAGVGIAACSSPPDAAPKKHTSSAFPIGAAAAASVKPVPVTMWHSMTSADLLALSSLTDRFNAAQRDVRVSLVSQNSYNGTLVAYSKATRSGTLPDLVQMDSSYLQVLIDGRTIVPVQQAIDADGFDLTDFVPATTESFRVGDTLWALPFNNSVQILYYDKAAFSRAGLDPDSPPTNMDEFHFAAKTLVKHGPARYGVSLDLTTSSFYQLMALGGQSVVNQQNGHQGRATAVMVDGAGGSVIFGWISQMLKSKLAQTVPSGSFDNLLAIANRAASMSLDTSSSLGAINQVIERGHYKDVDLAVAPTPVFVTSSSGGAGSVTGGLHLVDKASVGKASSDRASEEHLDAAWQYVKFLVSSSSQADWAVATGFVPVSKSAAQMPVVTRRWEATPGYRVAYQQLLANPGTAVASGPVIGAAPTVNNVIQEALSALASGSSSSAALTRASEGSNAAIAAYNKRL